VSLTTLPDLDARLAAELELLTRITSIPSAAGCEGGVIAAIRTWAEQRPGIRVDADAAGNLVLTFAGKRAAGRRARAKPLFITAHLDHPAFVVERLHTLKSSRGGPTVELSFRGGVMDVFFEHAAITLHTSNGPLPATLVGMAQAHSPLGKHYLAEIDDPDSVGVHDVNPGDIATWQLPPAEIDAQGVLHTLGCDDLSAVAACLCLLDRLLAAKGSGRTLGDVRVLFTRSEEIGFIGAIAACKLGTLPAGARVIALENSRAFADAPLGGGPIVRVGDRLSIFTPWLTAACAKMAERIFGGASTPTAAQMTTQSSRRPWQRKLMAGGACEASVFGHFGLDSTCLCLPLGNYHNMAHLDLLQAGTYDATVLGPPRAARESIHTRDFLGLVDLLEALSHEPPEPDAGDFGSRLDKLYAEKAHVLGPIARTSSAQAAKRKPRSKATPAASRRKSSKAQTKPATRRGARSGRG
jgi:putative aminopeptidase FrvX